MKLCRGVLLVLDTQATPFTRIWCCFEESIAAWRSVCLIEHIELWVLWLWNSWNFPKISGLNLHMLWLNVTWGGGTGHQLFATWCCCHRSWPCCPCHHWWLSRCWDPGSPHLGLALQVTPWAILSNGFASERPQRWHCYSTSVQRRGQDTNFELRAMSASQDMGVGHAFSNAAPPLWCRQQSFSLPLCTDQHPAVISERTTSPINPVASTTVRCRKKEHPSVTDRLPQFPRPGLADSHRQPAIQTAKFTARSCLHWFGAFGWSSGCFLRKRPSDPSDSLRRIFKKHFWFVCFALPFLETFGAVAVRPSRLRGHRVGRQQQGIVEASFGGACGVGWDLFSHHVTTAHPPDFFLWNFESCLILESEIWRSWSCMWTAVPAYRANPRQHWSLVWFSFT